MEFEYLFAIIRQFFLDPFNRKALAKAHDRIATFEAQDTFVRQALAKAYERIAALEAQLGPNNNSEKKPDLLQPFRVRSSMRDRKAKKEASFNKAFNAIREVSEAIERGEIQDVHIDKNG